MSDETPIKIPVVVCMCIADLPVPYIVSDKETCSNCGATVWISDSTPRPEGAKIWCNRCYKERGFKLGDRIMPLTERQKILLSDWE